MNDGMVVEISCFLFIYLFFMAEISDYENATNNEPYSNILKTMLKSRANTISTF